MKNVQLSLLLCVLAVWQKIKSGKEVERWRPEVEVVERVI